MITLTCKRCGFSFETEATTNTRCRRCRAVVRVPTAARHPNGSGHSGLTGEHTFGIVLLSCGHSAVVVVHPGRSLARILKQVEWECPDTGATVAATRALALLSEAEWEGISEQAFDLIVSNGSSKLGPSPLR